MRQIRLLAVLAALTAVFAEASAQASAQTATVVDRTETSVTIRYDGLTSATDYRADLFQGSSLLLQTSFSTVAPPPSPPPAGWWKPPAKPTWYWQLQGSIRSTPHEVYDIDGADNTPYPGKRNIAYFSAGTRENWRADASRFPSRCLGNSNGWPGERWVDTRCPEVRQVMADRIASFKAKGYDAVEPDNVDGYQNGSGFPLTGATQLDYNRFLARTAHDAGLAVFLKNDVDQVQTLQPDFDGAINEQCQQYSECGVYSAFLSRGKPVLHAEYTTKTNAKCSSANSAGRMLAFTNTALDGDKWQVCW